jgi:hypothetical protein
MRLYAPQAVLNVPLESRSDSRELEQKAGGTDCRRAICRIVGAVIYPSGQFAHASWIATEIKKTALSIASTTLLSSSVDLFKNLRFSPKSR